MGEAGDAPTLPPLPGVLVAHGGDELGETWGRLGGCGGCLELGAPQIRFSPHPSWIWWGGKGSIGPQFWKRSLGLKGIDGALTSAACVWGRKCGIEQLVLSCHKKLNGTGCNY